MNQRIANLLLLVNAFLCLTCGSVRAADSVQPNSKKLTEVPKYALKFIPRKPDELVQIDQGKFSVLVYSKRKGGENAPLESDILVFDKSGPRPALVYHNAVKEELYEPSIIAPAEWKLEGQPMVAITRQAGAAATVLDILSFPKNGKVKEVSRVTADRIEISKMGKQSAPVVVVYQRPEESAMYVPKLLHWAGSGFQDVSLSHPEFYLQFLEEINYKAMLDPENSILDREVIAKLLKLAGRKDEAKAVLVDLLKEANSGPTIEKSVVGRIQNQVIQLESGK